MCALECAGIQKACTGCVTASVAQCDTAQAPYSRIQRECLQISAKHLSVHSRLHMHTEIQIAGPPSVPTVPEYTRVGPWNMYFWSGHYFKKG